MSELNHCTKKMKFSIKDFFSKCDQIRRNCGFKTAEEILNGKLHFLCGKFSFICAHEILKVSDSILETLTIIPF